ncbi:BtaA family protein [Pelomyxa schiedti]|nr:BtaA family protein [Pelomyxa schiedti]
MDQFLQTVNYSSCNEDWRTELEALQINEHDRILCICGSGDRVLNLLPSHPQSITPLDMNACQLHLLQLKMAAIRALDYPDYAAFLGLFNAMDDAKRLSVYISQIAPLLPKASHDFWAAHLNMIAQGVLYSGRWESHFRRAGSCLQWLRGTAINQLFACKTIEEQRQFVDNNWDRWWFRTMIRFLLSRLFSKWVFGDPGFYAFADPEMWLGDYCYDCMLNTMKTHLAKDNFMLCLIFRGNLGTDLPPYLSPGDFDEIKGSLDRTVARDSVNGDLIQHLWSCDAGTYTKFSFSDVPSFIGQQAFERLLGGIIHAGEDGARFCIRLFLSGQRVPTKYTTPITSTSASATTTTTTAAAQTCSTADGTENTTTTTSGTAAAETLEGWLELDEALADHLSLIDRAFAYRFYVGTIRKPHF